MAGDRVQPRAEPAPVPAEVWPRVKEAAGPRLRAMLDQMTVREVTPRLLTLAVPRGRAAMARDHLDEIARLVQQTGTRGMSISLVDAPSESREAPPGADEPAPPAAGTMTVEEAERHPLVIEASRVFGARVVHVEPKPSRSAGPASDGPAPGDRTE